MKLFALVLFFLFIPGSFFAQSGTDNRCPYKGLQLTDSRIVKDVGDFTITTTDGITRNLYTTLDSGKTVFIDLFFTTCTWCQLYAPIIEQIYQDTGAGEADIEFWGISNNLNDPDPVIDQYKLNYNITNPCAGPQGGGTTAHSTVIAGQNFLGWPTYCVICPDRTMYFDPVYPPTVTGFNPYFENCAETVGVKDDDQEKDQKLRVYPNPAADHVFIDLNPLSDGVAEIRIINLYGAIVFTVKYPVTKGPESIKIPVGELMSGLYLVEIRMDRELTDSRKVQIVR